MAHSKYVIIIFLSIILSISAGCRHHSVPDTVTSHDSIESLSVTGMNALNKSLFDSAASCGRRLLEIAAKSTDDAAEKASLYGNILIGQSYLFSDSVASCYPMLHEAELLGLRTHNDSALASVYNGLGLYASNIEKDLPEALRYFFLGIDAAKRSSNERLHSLLLVNVALIYTLIDDPPTPYVMPLNATTTANGTMTDSYSMPERFQPHTPCATPIHPAHSNIYAKPR